MVFNFSWRGSSDNQIHSLTILHVLIIKADTSCNFDQVVKMSIVQLPVASHADAAWQAERLSEDTTRQVPGHWRYI
jgi:hypothetical protein